jgi:hypothetical protein
MPLALYQPFISPPYQAPCWVGQLWSVPLAFCAPCSALGGSGVLVTDPFDSENGYWVPVTGSPGGVRGCWNTLAPPGSVIAALSP